MAEFTTVQAVQADLGIGAASDADTLKKWIQGCSEWIERYLSQPIGTTAQQYVGDGRGGSTLALPYSPVQAVTSFSIDGVTVAAATPGGTDAGYFIDTRGLVRLRGLVFTRGVGNVVIGYTSGHATVPVAIERACCRMVAWRYREKERIGQSSKSIGGETISYQTEAAATDTLALLDQFRRVVPA